MIGDIEPPIDDDETALLMMPPKFAVLQRLMEEEFEVDLEMCFTKQRWSRLNEGDTKSLDDDNEMTEKEKEESEIIEAETRQIFDPIENVIDMRKLKVTDVKHNTKIYLPKALDAKSEAGIEVRRQKCMEIYQEYLKEFCDEKGSQTSNLSPTQKRGLIKLRKRIKNGEVVVCLTDKSGRMALMSMESYLEAGAVHTSKDREVDMDFARETERELNGHVAMWLKIIRMGEDWKHGDRHRETHINHSLSISALYLLIKDHKKYDPSEGPPPTRPVAGAVNGMNVHLSNILSPFLEAYAGARNDTAEVISTDDMLSKANKFNNKVNPSCPSSSREGMQAECPNDLPGLDESRLSEEGYDTDESEFLSEEEQGPNGKETVIVGADAEQLYPSLLEEQAGRLTEKAAMETKVKVEGINYKEAARYVAMESTETEIKLSGLRRVLPVRRFKPGTKPGVTGQGPMGPEANDEEQWIFPRVELTELEKKKLFATALKIGVKTAFRTHLYQFGGRIYHQTSGGPIGLRLAGAAARIVMGEWDSILLKRLVENGMDIEMAMRYVDDIRIVTKVLKKGWKWQDNSFQYRDAWKKDDQQEGLSDIRRTSRELQKVMNGIFKNLKFEMEIGEDFEDEKLPTLDYKCWMESNKILYSFYEKPMASKYTIMKKSALSENSKVASLSQDLVRRMKNTSERLTIKERVRIVNEYSVKLTVSGYKKDQVKKIIIAGLKGYEKLRLRDMKGEGKLHRSAAEGAGARHRKKLLGKTNWFKSKKSVGPSGNKHQTNTNKTQLGQKGKITRVQHNRNSQAKPGCGNTDELPVKTVLFVPQTPGGELANRLREAEKQLAELTGEKVKIVEKGGRTLKNTLHKSNPWTGGFCGRKDCLPCMTGDEKGDCMKRNIVYETNCIRCKENGKESIYVGESARTSYERGKEHQDDYQKEKADSHMEKHAQTEHPGEGKPPFAMKIVKTHFSAFSRQIHEAVRIRSRAAVALNSKGQYNRCQLPRLTVEMGDRKVEEEGEKKDVLFHQEWKDRQKNKSKRKNVAETLPRKRRKIKWCGGYKEGEVWGEVKNADSIAISKPKNKVNSEPVTIQEIGIELCHTPVQPTYEPINKFNSKPGRVQENITEFCHTLVQSTVDRAVGRSEMRNKFYRLWTLENRQVNSELHQCLMDYEGKTELCHTLVENTVSDAVLRSEEKSERLKKAAKLRILARTKYKQRMVAEICHTLVEAILERTAETIGRKQKQHPEAASPQKHELKSVVEVCHTLRLDQEYGSKYQKPKPVKRRCEEENQNQQERKKLHTDQAEFDYFQSYSIPNSNFNPNQQNQEKVKAKVKLFPVFERQVSTSKPSTQPKLSLMGEIKFRKKLRVKRKLSSYTMVGTGGSSGVSNKYSQGNTQPKQSSILTYLGGKTKVMEGNKNSNNQSEASAVPSSSLCLL